MPVSTFHVGRDRYRRNDGLFDSFCTYEIRTFEHFHHLGAAQSLRNCDGMRQFILERMAGLEHGYTVYGGAP